MKESAPKDVLKPIWNGDRFILDRSEAKNQNKITQSSLQQCFNLLEHV